MESHGRDHCRHSAHHPWGNMRLASRFGSWVRWVASRSRMEKEMDAELRFHIQSYADDLAQRGVPEHEAIRRARIEFGPIELQKDAMRQSVGLRIWDELRTDLRCALRMMRRNPGFTVVAVLSLALGIGANTAIFSAVNVVLLKNLPVRKPAELVLFSSDPQQGMFTGSPKGHWIVFSYASYEFFQTHNHVFEELCAFQSSHFPIRLQWPATANATAADFVSGQLVSGNYFSTLGVNAFIGRGLLPSDDASGAPPVAAISYGYWKKLGSDDDIVGRKIVANGTPFNIVGVAPPEFFGERMQKPPDLWLPLSAQPAVTQLEHGAYWEHSLLNDPQSYWLNMMGRLKPEVTLRQAQANIDVLLPQFIRVEKIDQSGGAAKKPSFIRLTPGAGGISELRLRYSQPLHILMGMVTLVLLIACVNVANLSLALATSREREFGLRLALGIGRKRLIRQLLTESLLLAGAGAVLGALLSFWGVKLLVRLVASPGLPIDLHPDLRVLLFTMVVCIASGLLSGIAPAFRSAKLDIIPSLKLGPAVTARHGRFASAKLLVATQVMLSLTLLVGTGLLTRTLASLQTQQLGFQKKGVLLVQVNTRIAGYAKDRLPLLYESLIDAIRALPGVKSASYATYSPISGSENSTNIDIPGHTPLPEENMSVWRNWVGPQYFRTMGIRILNGRALDAQDTGVAPPAIVISENLAREFFPREDPVGHKVFFGPHTRPEDAFEIVGVAADVKFDTLRAPATRMAYFSELHKTGSQFAYANEIAVRVEGDPELVIPELRQAVHQVDANLPISGIKTLNEQVTQSLQEERTIAEVSGFFSVLALVLAAIGVYGLLTYMVGRRMGEIGVHMALGASRGHVLRMVLREGLGVISTGILFGIPFALLLGRLIEHQLFGVRAIDSLTMAAAVVILLLSGAVAGLIPAMRAASLDPLFAIRQE